MDEALLKQRYKLLSRKMVELNNRYTFQMGRVGYHTFMANQTLTQMSEVDREMQACIRAAKGIPR